MTGAGKRITQTSSVDLETIDRGLTIVNLVIVLLGGLIWLSISLDNAQILAWYRKGKALFPFFDQAVLRQFIPVWIVILWTRIVAISAKLAYARYNLIVILTTVASYLITAVAIVVFLMQDGLLTYTFEMRMRSIGLRPAWLLAAAIAIICLTVVDAIIKAYRRFRLYLSVSA